MEKLLIGKIVKAQGIKGEVKIKSYLDNGNLFKTFKYLYLGDIRTAVKTARYSDGFAYVGFSTVVDRNQAETLRNIDVYADKEQITLDTHQFFIDDIMGSQIVLDDGLEVGKLVEIMQNPHAVDVYVAEKGENRVMFPFLKDIIVRIDLDSKVITLKADKFAEVAVEEE